MFSSAGQAQAFLATVYAGLAAGVAYDLLRLLRLSLKAGPWVTALLDLTFWVITAALVACAAALAGAPGLRLYLLLGTASGMLLWAAGLRQIIRAVGRSVLRLLPPPQAGKPGRGGELAVSTGETGAPPKAAPVKAVSVSVAAGESPGTRAEAGRRAKARAVRVAVPTGAPAGHEGPAGQEAPAGAVDDAAVRDERPMRRGDEADETQAAMAGASGPDDPPVEAEAPAKRGKPKRREAKRRARRAR